VLESFDPDASNGGLKVEIGPLGADLNTFEEVEWLQNLKKITGFIFNYLENRSFQKQLTLDRLQVVGFRRLAPPLDAPGSLLSSAL